MKIITSLLLICLTTLFVQAQNVTVFREDSIYLYGLKDNAGNIVVQPIYDYHEYLEYGLIKMRLDNNWTLFDSTGKEINFYHIIYDFEYVKDLKGKYARVEKNQKYGYIDTSGREVISPIYSMGGFSEGYALISVSNNHFGFIDVHGKLAIDTTLFYQGVGSFSNGLAEVWLSGYLYDGTGNIITDEAKISGYIDKTGKEVIPLKYQSKQEFFKDGTEILVINTKATDIRTYVGAKPTQQPVELFKSENGKYGFKKKNYSEEYGMYKMTDTILIQAKYDTVYQTTYNDVRNEIFNEGYLVVEIAGKKGLVDSLGNEVIAPAYYKVGNFSEGLAWVQPKQVGNFGYIDIKGNLIVDTILSYQTVGDFSEGLAVVTADSIVVETGFEARVFGFIDKTGKEIISLKYTSAENFKNGKAEVISIEPNNDGNFIKFYIDKKGNEIK